MFRKWRRSSARMFANSILDSDNVNEKDYPYEVELTEYTHSKEVIRTVGKKFHTVVSDLGVEPLDDFMVKLRLRITFHGHRKQKAVIRFKDPDLALKFKLAWSN